MSELQTTIGEYISSSILKRSKRQIRFDEPLISSGLVDSFSLVDLALFVEDKFGVHLDDTELNAQTFDTLDQLVSFIQSRQSQ